MNEKSPEENKNSESMESMETPLTKESVIESLRDNPENFELLGAYQDKRLKQIQAPYIPREETEVLTFKFNIEVAEIYRDAGLKEAAWDAYNDAADFAQANGMEEEYQKILAEMEKI